VTAPKPRPWVRLADVEPEPVAWLWRGRVPLGKLTVFDGDPGLGKSTTTLDLGARVSAGLEMPCSSAGDLDGPAGVVILSAEDGLADTIRPRLDAAGADVKRIVAFQLEALPAIPRQLAEIKAAVEAVAARLVIVDPLNAFLGGEVDSHRDQDIRRALARVTALAAETGAAIIVVRHLNKGTGPALYRGGGSIGIAGAARAGLIVFRDPEDELRRVLAPSKANLALEPPSLLYTLESVGNVARIRWLGETAQRADELAAEPGTAEERDALSDAEDVLRELLREGPRPAKEVQRLLREAGVAERAWRRAKSRLHVRSDPNGFQGAWQWSLPPNTGTPSETAKSDAPGAEKSNSGASPGHSDSVGREAPGGQTRTPTLTAEERARLEAEAARGDRLAQMHLAKGTG